MRFLPPINTRTQVKRRTPLPDWALVLFWLLIILLIATALALGANYNSLSGGAPAAAITAALPVTTSAAQVPPLSDVQAAGVIIVEPTPTAIGTPVPESPIPPNDNVPAEILLQEVPIGKQTRSLNCEFQTASDLAWYYGRPFTWEEIYQYVGHDVGGNPHKGFVGRSFDDAPGQLYPLGYGVYAEPIAEAFAQLGLTAEVSYNNSREWLMAQVAASRPVMVWATSNMTIRPIATWTAGDGVTVRGVPGEHTYLAVGYDASGVWLIDPWDGQRHYFYWHVFLASWDLLGRMALIVTGKPEPAMNLTPGP